MVGIVRLALSRPHTFVVMALLILIFGTLSVLRTPTDIFPDIKIPVIATVWSYNGLPADEIASLAPGVEESGRTRRLDEAHR